MVTRGQRFTIHWSPLLTASLVGRHPCGEHKSPPKGRPGAMDGTPRLDRLLAGAAPAALLKLRGRGPRRIAQLPFLSVWPVRDRRSGDTDHGGHNQDAGPEHRPDVAPNEVPRWDGRHAYEGSNNGIPQCPTVLARRRLNREVVPLWPKCDPDSLSHLRALRFLQRRLPALDSAAPGDPRDPCAQCGLKELVPSAGHTTSRGVRGQCSVRHAGNDAMRDASVSGMSVR